MRLLALAFILIIAGSVGREHPGAAYSLLAAMLLFPVLRGLFRFAVFAFKEFFTSYFLAKGVSASHLLDRQPPPMTLR